MHFYYEQLLCDKKKRALITSEIIFRERESAKKSSIDLVQKVMQPLLNDGQEKHVFNQKLICCNVLFGSLEKKVQFPFKARCQLLGVLATLLVVHPRVQLKF